MKKRYAYLGLAIVFAVLAMSACSGKSRPKYSRADRLKFIREHRLDKLPASDVPLEVNERVIAWMDYFSGSGARHFRRYMERSSMYIPQMQAILKKYGLPKDLVYVAMIESGFNNNAHSHAGAVGPWQFIRSTGRRYGLRVDTWVDERRNPVKATHAAARYLRDLYNEFGHWYLAMAGYNAGEGRVRRAIKDSGSRNFWVHADPKANHLRAETRDYVPKYIAANIMAKMPAAFGFGNISYQKAPEFEVVKIPTQTDLDVIAKCASTTRFRLEQLNPELRVGATPAGVSNYALKIPKGKKERFLVAYAKVPKEDRIKLVTYEVRKGDTMYKVARKHGVSTNALASANGLRRKSRLKRGTRLVIPVGAAYRSRVAKLEREGGGGSTSVVRYKVKRGDSIGKIARRYGVRTSQIRKWNRLNKRGTIRVGQRLKIYKYGRGKTRVASKSTERGAATGSHRVRSGETLWTIARKYDVSVDELKSWNGIKGNRIKPGQKLKLYGGSGTSSGASTEVATASKASTSSSAGTTSSEYRVKSGDTPGTIAQKHGVRLSDLIAWNGLNRKRPVVRTGQTLVIKRRASTTKKKQTLAMADTSETTAADEVSNTSAPKKTVNTSSGGSHVLQPGETLGHVAEAYGVSTKQIMKWNNIKNPRRVRAGKKLVIKGGKKETTTSPKSTKTEAEPATKSLASAPTTFDSTEIMTPQPEKTSEPAATRTTATAAKTKTASTKKTYKIQSGDSLWSIARKHNVSVNDIKRWNGIGESNKIKPGQKIVIKEQ